MGTSARYQRFLADLKRRHVFKVAAFYGAAAFAVMQAADFLVPALRLPEVVATLIALAAILGFPVAVALAYLFDRTPEGIKRTDAAASSELEAIVAQRNEVTLPGWGGRRPSGQLVRQPSRV